jgi:hypothetical protein
MIIEFDREEAAKEAMHEMDRIVIDDFIIKIQPAWQMIKR